MMVVVLKITLAFLFCLGFYFSSTYSSFWCLPRLPIVSLRDFTTESAFHTIINDVRFHLSSRTRTCKFILYTGSWTEEVYHHVNTWKDPLKCKSVPRNTQNKIIFRNFLYFFHNLNLCGHPITQTPKCVRIFTQIWKCVRIWNAYSFCVPIPNFEYTFLNLCTHLAMTEPASQ